MHTKYNLKEFHIYTTKHLMNVLKLLIVLEAYLRTVCEVQFFLGYQIAPDLRPITQLGHGPQNDFFNKILGIISLCQKWTCPLMLLCFPP
jgi:hypothetical protein